MKFSSLIVSWSRFLSRSSRFFSWSSRFLFALNSLSFSSLLLLCSASFYQSLLVKFKKSRFEVTSSALLLLFTTSSFHSSLCNSISACFSKTLVANSPRLLMENEKEKLWKRSKKKGAMLTHLDLWVLAANLSILSWAADDNLSSRARCSACLHLQNCFC